MSHTLSLYRMQQTDSQIGKVHSRLEEIKKLLENDDVLRAASMLAEAAGIRVDEMEASMQQAEATVQRQRIKIEQAEASLYGGTVRNPKELQDLENDGSRLKRHMSLLEDRLLEAMQASENAQANRGMTFQSLTNAQEQAAQLDTALHQEQMELLKDLQRLEAEKKAISGSVPENILVAYDNLRQQRRGLAVTRILDQNCEACGATLTPAQQQIARSASQTLNCPSCGRIVYGN